MATIEGVALAFLASALEQGMLLATAGVACAWLARLSPARQRHRLWMASLVLALVVPAWAALDVAPRTTAGLPVNVARDASILFPAPPGAPLTWPPARPCPGAAVCRCHALRGASSSSPAPSCR